MQTLDVKCLLLDKIYILRDDTRSDIIMKTERTFKKL